MLEIILPYLYKLFNVCLDRGYCPEYFKETITVVLRKPDKDNYSLLKLY